MSSYEIIVGLAVELSVITEDCSLANEIKRPSNDNDDGGGLWYYSICSSLMFFCC